MRENGRFPTRWANSNDCILEGFADRPEDCPNNPFKYPDNYRPQICNQCSENPEIWKTAQLPLPSRYILFKQGRTEKT